MAASLPAGLNSSAQPSPRLLSSSSSRSPPPATTVALHSSPEDVKKEVEKEIRNLHSEDQIVVAKAAAALVMLATLPGAEPYLLPSVSRLSLLLENVEAIHIRAGIEGLEDICREASSNQLARCWTLDCPHMEGEIEKRNACAALTAIMNASFSLYIAIAKSPYLMERLLQCLENQDGDIGLQINATAAISFLAHCEEGLEILKIAEADVKLLSLLEHAHDVRLEEEITDALCSLAVHEEMRYSLVQKGAVSRLASKLTRGSPEICVRALLGLGMLCGSSQEAQEHFVGTDGAIATLLSLMKSNDQDIRAIAHDLCAALSSNEQVKPIIEQLLRSRFASRTI